LIEIPSGLADQDLAARVARWRSAERAKANRLLIRSLGTGLLGLGFAAVGPFFWPMWVAGVIALCVGFYQWKEAVMCRVGANTTRNPEDFLS
jgi:hypothetical protein